MTWNRLEPVRQTERRDNQSPRRHWFAASVVGAFSGRSWRIIATRNPRHRSGAWGGSGAGIRHTARWTIFEPVPAKRLPGAGAATFSCAQQIATVLARRSIG